MATCPPLQILHYGRRCITDDPHRSSRRRASGSSSRWSGGLRGLYSRRWQEHAKVRPCGKVQFVSRLHLPRLFRSIASYSERSRAAICLGRVGHQCEGSNVAALASISERYVRSLLLHDLQKSSPVDYPQSWTLEAESEKEDEDEDDDEDEENEDDDPPKASASKSTVTTTNGPSQAYAEFLQFLAMGCSGSPIQGYPTILVILSTIPSSVSTHFLLT